MSSECDQLCDIHQQNQPDSAFNIGDSDAVTMSEFSSLPSFPDQPVAIDDTSSKATVALETEAAASFTSKPARARNRKKSRWQAIPLVQDRQNDSSSSSTPSPPSSPPPAQENCTTQETLSNDKQTTVKDEHSEQLPTGPASDQKERKISRIFWMLQSMHQTFIQPPNASSESSLIRPTLLSTPSSSTLPVILSADSSGNNAIELDARNLPTLPRTRSLYGLGQSQDSITFSSSIKNPIRSRLDRFGSINSWAGSEYSESSLLSSSTSYSAQPPLMHMIPYHRDASYVLFRLAHAYYLHTK